MPTNSQSAQWIWMEIMLFKVNASVSTNSLSSQLIWIEVMLLRPIGPLDLFSFYLVWSVFNRKKPTRWFHLSLLLACVWAVTDFLLNDDRYHCILYCNSLKTRTTILNIGFCSLTCEPISFKLGMMIDNTKLYSMEQVGMTLTFTQGWCES